VSAVLHFDFQITEVYNLSDSTYIFCIDVRIFNMEIIFPNGKNMWKASGLRSVWLILGQRGSGGKDVANSQRDQSLAVESCKELGR
ncbi:MAG: hypothetical protein ACSHX7_14500, partial [Luteolibacter sp.]